MGIKEKQITSICTLSSMDCLITSEIASRIDYNVNIDLMQINVPHDQIEVALVNKDVLELRDKYKFSIQSTII